MIASKHKLDFFLAGNTSFDSKVHTSQLSLGDWTFGNNIENFE